MHMHAHFKSKLFYCKKFNAFGILKVCASLGIIFWKLEYINETYFHFNKMPQNHIFTCSAYASLNFKT